MGQDVKQIAVISGSTSTRDRICAQLERMLEDHAKVVGYSVTEGLSCCISADLLVYSSLTLVEEAKGWVDQSCPKIVARRAVDSVQLDQLFHIRRASTVLLVNDDKDSALESIELLTRLGIDHFDMLPWYPELSDAEKAAHVQRCHMAITLGEMGLVPKEMLSAIDLGPRIIDISTIVEILHYLDLLDEKSHFLSATYFATAVKLSKTVHKAMAEQESLNERLMQVLHQINDGLFAYDKEGCIRVFSQKAELIFGMRASRTVGKPLTQVFKNEGLLNYLKAPDTANEAIIRIGGSDYAVQKFESAPGSWMVCTLRNLSELAELEQKRRRQNLQKGHVAKYGFEDIIYESEIMAQTIETAEKIAKTKLSVLIYGESGTGKELFASAMHRVSSVSEGPFLAVNFSALPEDLVESELFGYEEGAFTGAKKGGKAGLFEQADGGTLFLDEIGDISLKIQARLLRVLQEKEIMRVGGTEVIPVDVRIIAATNKPLFEMTQSGKFREDLYYRLKRLSLNPPPLRARREDIALLAAHFLKKNGWKGNLSTDMSATLKKALYDSPWIGNVRELESVTEYLSAVSDPGSPLDLCHLPSDFLKGKGVNGEVVSEMGVNGEELPHFIPPARGDLQAHELFLSQDYYFLLREVKKANDSAHSIGRERLSELACLMGLMLTEDMVRTRLKHLETKGYLHLPKGRRGPVITLLGRQLLEKYE